MLEADQAVLLGPPPPAQSYLDVDAVLRAARETGPLRCTRATASCPRTPPSPAPSRPPGLVWVGPDPAAIEQMGDKVNARNLMAAAGRAGRRRHRGAGADRRAGASREAARIGYPLMVKASAGGGGIGMSVAYDEDGLRAAFETARSRAERFFGNPAILLERYVEKARHVEVQIVGLADGRVVALGERDCSVQRRHQKVAEETPSPGVRPELRARMLAAAVRAGEAVGYRGAGTVECLVDTDAQEFVFLEMNTRLQVEHPVTEMVTGLDLVELQLLVASGEQPASDPAARDPAGSRDRAARLRRGPGPVPARAGCRSGCGVEPTGRGAGRLRLPGRRHRDAVLRPAAGQAGRPRRRPRGGAGAGPGAVAGFEVEGPKCNLAFFPELLDHPDFVSGRYDTGMVDRMRARPAPLDCRE